MCTPTLILTALFTKVASVVVCRFSSLTSLHFFCFNQGIITHLSSRRFPSPRYEVASAVVQARIAAFGSDEIRFNLCAVVKDRKDVYTELLAKIQAGDAAAGAAHTAEELRELIVEEDHKRRTREKESLRRQVTILFHPLQAAVCWRRRTSKHAHRVQLFFSCFESLVERSMSTFIPFFRDATRLLAASWFLYACLLLLFARSFEKNQIASTAIRYSSRQLVHIDSQCSVPWSVPTSSY